MTISTRKLTPRLPGLMAGALAAVLACSPGAMAAEALRIENAWARAAPGVPNGAAFVTMVNAGPTADRLIGAATDAAQTAELHTHLHEGGIMRMRKVDAIPIPANGTVTLAPGGDHVMLFDLKRQLKEGQTFTLKLTFANAGTIPVEVPVLGAGATGPAAMGVSGHQGMHGGMHQ